jgi:signal transduction histidine kinase
LVVALQQLGGMLQSRYKLASSVNAPLEPSVSLEVKGALYRIAQEAVHNAVKHAHAQHISIALLGGVLEIADNGVGFDTTAARTGTLGLKSMQERASSIKAVFSITSQKDLGSRVRVHFTEEKA